MRGRAWGRAAAPALLGAGLLVACSPHVDLPAAARGVWRQADMEAVRLRLEDKGGRAEAYLSTGGEDWFGPMGLRAAGPNAWSFERAARTDGDRSRRGEPPEAKRNPDNVIVNGRLKTRAYDLLPREGSVTLRLEGDRLVARGLWMRIETLRWDAAFQPEARTFTPLETTFVRGGRGSP